MLESHAWKEDVFIILVWDACWMNHQIGSTNIHAFKEPVILNREIKRCWHVEMSWCIIDCVLTLLMEAGYSFIYNQHYVLFIWNAFPPWLIPIQTSHSHWLLFFHTCALTHLESFKQCWCPPRRFVCNWYVMCLGYCPQKDVNHSFEKDSAPTSQSLWEGRGFTPRSPN